MTDTGIELREYVHRREQVLKALKGAVGAVFAGKGEAPLSGRWRPHAHFLYVTGLESESDAVVLFDPTAEDVRRRCVLFLKPVDPEADRWDGYRDMIGAALRERTGFQTIVRLSAFPLLLMQAARRSKRLACLHPFSVHEAPVSPDLAVFRKVSEHVPGIAIEDQTELLKEMRAVKSAAELRLMGRAIEATAAGYQAAMRTLRPGVSEATVQDAIEGAYRECGTRWPAFNSIVGSGLNATILHYMSNEDVAREGDLVVIDSGASCGGYAADVTRTLPVSGVFTEEQAEIYRVVLRAQEAAIACMRPGAKMAEVDLAARRVIEKAGLGDAFIHGIGHQLGIEVHDVSPECRLKAGMVITVEPGVYLRERGLGIRIEDDVLVTRTGRTILTGTIPRTIEAIESAMGGGDGRRRRGRRSRGR
jgi:Xaa-Pro aminopeptidase